MFRDLTYVHPSLDRAAHLRGDVAWQAAALADPASRLLPVWQGRNLITGPREAPLPVLLSAAEPGWRDAAGEIVFLGLAGGTAHFAVEIALAEPQAHPWLAGRGTFADLRSFGPLVPPEEAALCAYARGILWWHFGHRFCGRCGHTTAARAAGHQRHCTNPACGAHHFPRTDPAVIVLVTDGERCLLGRQKVWPAGMHSVLAGFVEPGESLEGCVRREVREETGVAVGELRYFASQPWPFPQSLMIGFTARATATAITVDPAELEHAAWYERAWLRSLPPEPLPGAPFWLPRRDSIARRMIESWLAEPS